MKSTAAPNYAFHRKSFPLRSKVSGELNVIPKDGIDYDRLDSKRDRGRGIGNGYWFID